MRRLGPILALALCLSAGHARATPVELGDLVSADRPVGCSTYRFMFWDFYRAELWSDARDLPGESFALSLTYLSEFSRDELVTSSVDELVRMSGLPESRFVAVRGEMERVFRDVAPGDRITAWRAGTDRLRVFVNGRETGVLTRDVDRFLAIWLGEGTRDPDGRAGLLAGRCDG